jgi:hypothetical protein
MSNIADLRDGPMNSMAVLRRDLVKVPIPKVEHESNSKFRMDYLARSNQAAIVIELLIQAHKLLNCTSSYNH